MTGALHIHSAGDNNSYSNYDVLLRLSRFIDKELEMLARQVSGGQLESFDTYKYKCGMIKGLSDVKSAINELRRSDT